MWFPFYRVVNSYYNNIVCSCGLNTSTVCSFKVCGSAVIMCTYFLNDAALILSNLSPD